MKKNFFKKLALVMALALTVTSVPATSASAAAAPGFKSKAVKVNVGQTKKFSTANSTKYSVKFKIGNKSVATIATSKKAVKVTGVAAGKTTLKATFKNYKTKKVTTAKVPVTVIEEATTLKSVEAKGVKTLVATFNKAVDDTKAVVAVTKGNAKPSVSTTKWAEDKKSVTVTMGSKLTDGTYELSVTGLTTDALKGSVSVKDEKLTSIEFIGTNLTADGEPATVSTASIGFKVLNQYGEKMAAPGTVNITSSFGAKAEQSDATSTSNGKVTFTVSSPTLRVYGTSGSVTAVETSTGVTATATVTYSAKATAKTMTVKGLYDSTDAKIKDISKGDTASNFFVLATIADQYGNALNAKALNNSTIKATLVAGNTGITGPNTTGANAVVTTFEDKTVDGVDYVALKLEGGVVSAGTFYMTIVNNSLGLLANTSFTVQSGTVIKSLSISANDTIYQGSKNELNFEAVDTDGNAVTKYSTLKNLVSFSTSGTDKVRFEKKSDGTAKLVYIPSKDSVDKNYLTKTFTTTVNDNTSTSYFVKSNTFNTYAAKVATEVTGVKSGTKVAVASGGSLTIDLGDLVVEDQYSNVMSSDEVKALDNLYYTIAGTGVATTVTTPTNIPARGSVKMNGILGNTVTIKNTLTVGFLKDAKLSKSAEISIYTVDASKATSLSIDSIKDGNVVKADGTNKPSTIVTPGAISVIGKVSGYTVELPSDYYVVTGNTGENLGSPSTTNTVAYQTLTATLDVAVNTSDGTVMLKKDYSYSNAGAKITKIESNTTTKVAPQVLDATVFEGLFTMKDQYGDSIAADKKSGVKYEVIQNIAVGSKESTIKFNNTNNVSVSTTTLGDEFTVIATYGDISVSKTITIAN